MLDRLRNDLSHAFRLLVRGRGFTAIALLTLALGIGANSAMFTVVNTLLLRPLPYPEGDRLIWIATTMATSDNLPDWRTGMRTLEQVEAFTLNRYVRTGDGPAQRVQGMQVTPGLLPLLGAQPLRGRLWTESEHALGEAAGILISHQLWTSALAGGAIADQTLLLSGTARPVLGVLPAEFENLGYADTDVWELAPVRGETTFNLIGLRRPGVTLAEVQAEASQLIERVESPLVRLLGRRIANVQTVGDTFSAEIATPMLVIFAAAGFVLLIACANVANLLLSRAAGRTRELAVRTALGASRATLVRQLLTESALLSLIGGLAGLLVAWWALRGVVAIAPSYRAFDRLADISIGVAVFAFTFLATGLTTLLAGLAPALAGARSAANAATSMPRSTSTRGARRWREALIAAEVALALVLTIGTILLVRTFLTLRPASPGFDVSDRLILSVSVPADGGMQNAEFARTLLREIEAATPGVRPALVNFVPLSGLTSTANVMGVDGTTVSDAEQAVRLHFRPASPNYHEVMGIPVVRGRGLLESDRPGSPNVIVLNETAARVLWPDVTDPTGRTLTLEAYRETLEVTVAGVVRDTRFTGNTTQPTREGFVSYWQAPLGSSFQVVVHTPAASNLTGETLRRIVGRLAPDYPVGEVTSMAAIAGRAVDEPRFHMTLMTIFGGLGVLLAIIGCYGVLAYSVAQRTREIGVRAALGASRQAILRSVLGRAALLIASGLAAGALLALLLTRVLESSLFGVSATDPLTFGLASGILAVVSMAAAFIPAARAAAVHPSVAIRLE